MQINVYFDVLPFGVINGHFQIISLVLIFFEYSVSGYSLVRLLFSQAQLYSIPIMIYSAYMLT